MNREHNTNDLSLQNDPASAWLGKRPPRFTPTLVAIAIFTTLTLIFLIYIFDLFPGKKCDTVDECVSKADQMASAGKFEPALECLDIALELAGEQPDPAYAYVWCRRGDVLRLSSDPEEAISAYHTCIDWSEEDAAYVELRAYAHSWLEQLETP